MLRRFAVFVFLCALAGATGTIHAQEPPSTLSTEGQTAPAAEPEGEPATEPTSAATPTAAPAPASTPAHLAGTYDTGSIAWLLVSSALVFFMMPGLALFYGGMVRSKNLLNMFMCVMVCVPLVCVEWVAYGYSMAFAVPSAIATDAGTGDDGKPLPKLSYLGWDPNLVFFKSFSQVEPVDGADSYGKIVTTGDTVGAVGSGVPELLFELVGIGATAAYVLVVSTVCWLALKYTMGIRVSPEEETEGLDHGEHGNEAYHGFVMATHTA